MSEDNNELMEKRQYQKKYYSKAKKRLATLRAERYRTDPEFRERQHERNRKWQAERRAKNAAKKLEKLANRSAERWQGKKLRGPRIIQVAKAREIGHCTDDFARYVCRSKETIRRWLATSVLPGVSLVEAGGTYWFTEGYCRAVKQCLEEVLFHEGRGSNEILARLIEKRFKEQEVHYEKVR